MHYEKNQIPISPKLDAVVNKSLHKIYKKHRKIILVKTLIGVGSIAAIFTLILFYGNANPALAKNWPLIGHIFQQVETNISYKGNFSEDSTPLVTEESTTEETTSTQPELSPYVQSSNGITMTISEVYYNRMALYLSVRIENEEEFPPDFKRTENMKNYRLDYDRLELVSTGTADFYNQNLSPYYIEGKFQDMHTFIGIIRVDLSHLSYCPTDEELINAGIDNSAIGNDETYQAKIKEIFPNIGNTVYIPDHFTYNLAFTRIWAKLLNNEGSIDPTHRKRYDGEWNFQLAVSVDDSKTQTVAVNKTSETGLGISKVNKTPYEITVEPIIPTSLSPSDYFIAICDSNGDLLEFQGEYADTYQTYQRDTSNISVFLCDYDEYMNHLKGYYWSDDYSINRETKTFAEYLKEYALYSTEVTFQQ
jgi:hypothetical protein